jgi:hypothetical protein
VDLLASAVSEERVRKRLWRDGNALLEGIRSELREGGFDLDAEVLEQAGQVPYVNISMDIVWDVVTTGDERRDEYVRTNLTGVQVSAEDRYADEYDADIEKVVSIERSFPYFKFVRELRKANLETTSMLEPDEVRRWVLAHRHDMQAIGALPTDEKIRLLDLVIAGSMSDDALRAIYYICLSVTDDAEARFVSDELEPRTVEIGDMGVRYKVRAILDDMRRHPGDIAYR